MKLRSLIIVLFGLAITLPGLAKNKRGKRPMKLISYNIEYGMRADTTTNKSVFAAWIRSQNPDIVCLQEANKFTQKSLEALAASYGHPYAVLQKEKGFPTAITSKYPIVNIMKVEDNMWHGFVMGIVDGYHIISLHLSPHRYESRQRDIDLILETIRQSGPFEKWIIMGDFNSVSPVDAEKYADGRLVEYLRKAEGKRPQLKNLVNGKIDYSVHQRILDFGFIDSARLDKNFSETSFGTRIDFIYISPDLRSAFTGGNFIIDDFTRKYSDHRPLYITWEK